ncbi:S-layer homology domain-containing protein [Paenibacillus yanchengensis]|uniref:S-layer homology domain-containing protein n=1 Tax=Paenibacillus yanchengensis TaxID=2035833 RepID=A0ABW4YFJ8_9BACL
MPNINGEGEVHLSKNILLIVLCAMLFSIVVIENVGAASNRKQADRNEVIVRTSYMAEKEASVIFTIVGMDGAFTSSVMLPSGKVIQNEKSQKNNGKWESYYMIQPAQKGTYTFKIQAPKQAYYAIHADVPLFADITNHWGKSVIEEFVKKGIVNGKSKTMFAPDERVTGEEFIKMLVLALTDQTDTGERNWSRRLRWNVIDQAKKEQLDSGEYNFSIKKGKHWSEPYIGAFEDLQFNIATNHFNKELKRKDVALILSNVITMTNDSKIKTATFKDVAKLDTDYKQAIATVSQFSIFNGYADETFKPEQPVTRAEAVTVLRRLVLFLTN